MLVILVSGEFVTVFPVMVEYAMSACLLVPRRSVIVVMEDGLP